MKIYLGPFRDQRPFYDLLDKIGVPNKWNHKFHDALKSMGLIERPRTIKIRIDKYDSWNADETIAMIVVPLLKQLKKEKHGIPGEFLKDQYPYQKDDETDKEYEARTKAEFAVAEAKWDEVMDKMIFAFESSLHSWDDKFWKVRPEIDPASFEPEANGRIKWKVDGVYDNEGAEEYQKYIDEGLMLFAKYYKNLWD